MLSASRLQPKPGATDLTIAGNASGKRILCSRQALPQYNKLLALASKRNYWATLIVKSITGLSSGRLAKDNIYIKQRTSIAYGTGDAFYLVMPGVSAALDSHPGGGYILQMLNVDNSYETLQKQAQNPGLWKVVNKEERPEFLNNGKITKKDIRPVVISDMTNEQLPKVVRAVHDSLITIEATAGATRHYGFDLHFTPGESGIRGLKKAKDALLTNKDAKIVKSALLLANTMYQARNQNGVIWFSDFGGSAILTRALQILQREKGITLENHAIFMHHPTSMSKEAIAAAKDIGLSEFDKKSGILNPKEFIGHFTFTDKPLKKTGAAAATGLTTAGVAFGFMGASLTTAGIVGVAGGLLTVSKAIVSGAKNTRIQKY